MRKVLSVMMSFLFLVSIAGAVQGFNFTMNSANAVIVLPTTKIVNGQPLHIGEDAITGSRLGALLVLKGIRQMTYSTYVDVPIEYHSILIEDNDQCYKLNSIDMPDVGINVSDTPVGDAIVIAVNFSRVLYNDTIKKAQFNDRSIEIIFNENTTPLNLGEETNKMVSTVVDGKDTLYIYSYEENSGSKALGETLTVGGWKIKFRDIDTEQEKTLVDITFPSGFPKTDTLYKNKYYILYVDANGDEDFEPFDTYPSARIQELLQNGVKKIFVFSPTDFFIGIGGTRQVTYKYEYYEKIRMYQDGEIYEGQWVWDIDPENNLFTLYLHVDPENNFPKVTLGEGEMLKLPIGGLNIQPVFAKDENGEITGIEGYKFIRIDTIKKKVTVPTTKAEVTNDVNKLIIEDTQLTELPTDKHVIIVGGWVSNKAWELLEQVYGSSTIQSIKDEIMSKGYVIKILDNPRNPEYKVIILAGKDYTLTRKAVEEFMDEL
ncbi:S-layer protein [Thermococcus sp. M39]|uniref:S-layer protein n=1 Tax=unclassified Thermococcus TaxID=2627626 RepID=UPI001439881B|nr:MULTISPECIES: S-layer protein [unclassified Thermococcus]NJE08167.1 S-layer protein [Thermococcus sp. M39]NJE11660.1 S-layer protein [Thermococcus sp. LS2]